MTLVFCFATSRIRVFMFVFLCLLRMKVETVQSQKKCDSSCLQMLDHKSELEYNCPSEVATCHTKRATSIRICIPVEVGLPSHGVFFFTMVNTKQLKSRFLHTHTKKRGLLSVDALLTCLSSHCP